MITEISARFVNLKPGLLDRQIEKAQKTICQSLGIDLSALWQWSDDSPPILTITHLFSPPEGPEKPVGIDAHKAFPWVFKHVLRGETLTLDTEKMPPEARHDRDSRRGFGIQSSVIIPLCSGGDKIIGVLTFDALKTRKHWQEPIVDRLVLVAQIFSSALARRSGELRLKESEQRLRMAVNAAGVGLWAMDIETENVWVSSELRKILQFDQNSQINYNSFIEKIIEQDREKVEKATRDTMEFGKKLNITYRIILSDGGIRWVSASGELCRSKEGKPMRIMGASIDSSGTRQMEDKLKTQLEKIKMLQEKLEAENVYLHQKIEVQYVHEEIIAQSAVMKRILNKVEQVADTEATVLIEGETGTGKELIARAVHRLSSRNKNPLITVNCASLPATLVESELFGREKGAYTGAMTKMIGRFETADGATLFLDEIGELPMEIQAKLLRVLEQGSFERLGDSRTIHVDVRIIAATNKDLLKLVAEGRFRKDLYFRLNIFPIKIPPLRERTEDIPPLAWSFARGYEKKMGKRVDNIPRKCMDALIRYQWPGNARELRNVIERSLITHKGRTLQVMPFSGEGHEPSRTMSLEEMEYKHITAVLEEAGWRVSGKGSAAEILGLKRTTLQSRMKKLGIQRPLTKKKHAE